MIATATGSITEMVSIDALRSNIPWSTARVELFPIAAVAILVSARTIIQDPPPY